MSHRFTVRIVASAFTALTLLTIPALSFAGPYHTPAWRMRNQQGRIFQESDKGKLVHVNFRHLERQQYRTARLRSRFRNNDGHIGPRERGVLQHRLNRTSRSIYRARHN